MAAALGAAFLFGLSAPVAKLLLARVEPLMLSAILYLGAGLGVTALRAMRRDGRAEAALRAADLPLLLAMTAAGGVAAPLLLLAGLRRVSAVNASLLLNLEGPLTVLLAVAFFGDHLGRRAALGAATVMLAAATLSVAPGMAMAADVWGVLGIAGACALWALDNNLMQRLSLRDPLALAQVKGLVGGGFALLLAVLGRHDVPAVGTLSVGLLLGFVSYGLSVALAAYAMRAIGAAREAALFSTAPFIGVVVSVMLLNEALGSREVMAMVLMLTGLVLLARDRHSHHHAHEPLRHEHRHVHDVHHRHAHAAGDPPGEPHVHEHLHTALEHAHPHVSDVHHRHH